MDQKSLLLGLAASGLVAGLLARSQEAEAGPKKIPSVECFGINSCKGANGCGVGQAQVSLAQKVYKDRFKSTKLSECAGTAEASAKDGFLAWVKKDSKAECFKDGGFVYIKGKGDSLKIEDKDGSHS